MKHCIILHLYYQDLWPEFREKIQPLLSDSVHLYVTVNEETEYTDNIRSIANEVYTIENRGADIAPFIYVYGKICNNGYETYLKLHGKKSVHTPNLGDTWRRSLYFPIVENYKTILQQTAGLEMPYMVGVSDWYFDMFRESKDHPNKLNIWKFLSKSLQLLNIDLEGSFFAGTMFLTNDTYLKRLFNNIDLDILYNEFEIGHPSHSLAHGFERALGYGIHHHGGTYVIV